MQAARRAKVSEGRKSQGFTQRFLQHVVQIEILPESRMVTKEYHLGFMRRLHEAIRKKRP